MAICKLFTCIILFDSHKTLKNQILVRKLWLGDLYFTTGRARLMEAANLIPEQILLRRPEGGTGIGSFMN